MADQVQSPEAAAPIQSQNPQEIKPEVVSSQQQSEVKNENPVEQLKKEEPLQAETAKQEDTPVVEQAKKEEEPRLEAVKQEETPVGELAKKDEQPKLEAVKQEETPVGELVKKEEEPKLETEKQEETPVVDLAKKDDQPAKQEETPVVKMENKDEQPKLEVQQQETQPTKNEEPKLEEGKLKEAGDSNAQNLQNEATPKQLDWHQRELELLKKISELEKVKNERSEDGLKLEIKVREEEIDLLKARVRNLETELQAAMSKPSGKNHEMIENIKQQHEELLSKARGMIFDKTKMVKNQELQIEALTTQVQSLKDINVITKDLLEIRNSEVKAMEERLQAMEARFKAEKDRYGLVLQRAQTSTNINDDLRKEYETQLAIFKELREKYELRVQALVAENARLKEEALRGGTSGGTSG